MQDFHRALEHNALEKSSIKEIYAGFRVIEILPYPHGGSIGREEYLPDAFPFPRWKHCLCVGKSILVHGADNRNTRLVDHIADCLARISHFIDSPSHNELMIHVARVMQAIKLWKTTAAT